MKSHERALEWRELFMIASLVESSEEEMAEIAYRVAGVLRVRNMNHFSKYLLLQRNLRQRNGILKLGKFY